MSDAAPGRGYQTDDEPCRELEGTGHLRLSGHSWNRYRMGRIPLSRQRQSRSAVCLRKFHPARPVHEVHGRSDRSPGGGPVEVRLQSRSIDARTGEDVVRRNLVRPARLQGARRQDADVARPVRCRHHRDVVDRLLRGRGKTDGRPRADTGFLPPVPDTWRPSLPRGARSDRVRRAHATGELGRERTGAGRDDSEPGSGTASPSGRGRFTRIRSSLGTPEAGIPNRRRVTCRSNPFVAKVLRTRAGIRSRPPRVPITRSISPAAPSATRARAPSRSRSLRSSGASARSPRTRSA